MGKKLDGALAKIQKDYKINIKSARDVGKIKRLVLDSPSLNYIFSGGMPLGRILFIQGPESGGKSSIATYIATQIQKKLEGKQTVVYLDYENTFDAEHAEEMGLDVDNNFIAYQPDNAEDGFNMVKDLASSGEVGLVIVDSISAMSSKAACDDAFSGFAGGKTAAVIASGIRMLLPYLRNNDCTLLFISQERANMGAMYGPDFKATGGRAPAFYSSWSARVTRTDDILGPNKELAGIEIRVRNTKNKVGIAKRDANLKLYFDRGIDSEEEYMDYLKVLGLVEQKGAYYSNPDWVADDGTIGVKVCGMDKLKEFLKNNPKLYSDLKDQVNQIISKHTNLDNAEQELSEEELASGAWDTVTLDDGTVINSEGEILEEPKEN